MVVVMVKGKEAKDWVGWGRDAAFKYFLGDPLWNRQ